MDFEIKWRSIEEDAEITMMVAQWQLYDFMNN